jgi:hypothetical protein
MSHNEKPASNLVAQAEALYESHLRARWQRAARQARFAKMDVLRDPRNAAKLNQLHEAEREVRALETQLAIQVARVAEARAAAEQAPMPAMPDRTAIDADPPSTFRTAQSAKAEETFQEWRLRTAAEQLHARQTSAMFHAAQTEKAHEAIKKADANSSHCPGCGTAVTPGTVRCDCGYVLLATESNSDFISAEELAALRGS